MSDLGPQPNNQKGQSEEMAKNVRNPSGYHSSGRTLEDKANNFGKFVKQFGWAGKWTKDQETGHVSLFCRRGENETIEIVWHYGGGGTVHYTLAGERIKCHNVSAAAAIAQKEPDATRLRKAIRKRRRQLGVVDPEAVTEMLDDAQCSLPFDHESTDAEIKVALFNRSITWINRQSGQVSSAIVKGKLFKVVRRTGRAYIDFVDDYGFHAVYLDSIVSVG